MAEQIQLDPVLSQAQCDAVIKTDAEYFEGYGVICGLYEDKNGLMKKYSADNNVSIEVKDRLKAEIQGVNKKIALAESDFWGKVSEAIKEGVQFVFEKWSDKYALNLFEKKIVLFCLHVEIRSIGHKTYEYWEVAQLLNTSDSFLDRLSNNLSFFTYKTPLIEHSIIVRRNCHGYVDAPCLMVFRDTIMARICTGR